MLFHTLFLGTTFGLPNNLRKDVRLTCGWRRTPKDQTKQVRVIFQMQRFLLTFSFFPQPRRLPRVAVVLLPSCRAGAFRTVSVQNSTHCANCRLCFAAERILRMAHSFTTQKFPFVPQNALQIGSRRVFLSLGGRSQMQDFCTF